MEDKKRNLLMIAVIVSISIVIYLPILRNGFVFDDHGLIEQNTYIRDISNIPTFFSTDLWSFYFPEYQTNRIRYWRPLLLSTWAMIYQVFGLNPTGFHLASILFHALATLFAFLLARDITDDERVALVSAAIFAFHPVHVDAVAWASGLSDLLVALSVMATLACYHRFRARHLMRWGAATLVLLMFALLSKENAVMTPGVLIAYECLIGPSEKRKRAILVLVGTCLIAMAYFAVRQEVMGLADIRFPQVSLGRFIATLIVVGGHYARLLVFPFQLVATYPNRIYSITGLDILKGFFFLSLFGIFLAAVLRNRKDVFWLFFGGLTLLPAFNIIGVGPDLLAERYLYLPSVGFCVLLAQFLLRVLSKRLSPRAVTAVLGVILASYAARDLTRFADWYNELTYLKVTLRDAPDAYIHHNNLGNYLREQLGDLEGAQKEFEAAVLLSPDYEYAHSNLAIVLLEKDKLNEALHHALRASELQPKWVDPLISAAEAAGRLGRLDQSRELLLRALSLEPENGMAHNNMGNVDFMQGNIRGAIEWWEKAVQLDPSNISVLYNLAMGYEMMGDPAKAVHYYRLFSEDAPAEMEKLRQIAAEKADHLSGLIR